MIRIDDPETTVNCKLGQLVNLEVPGGGPTGHLWRLDFDHNALHLTAHERRPGTKLGAGGVEVFRLQPLRAGMIEVNFFLAAPWARQPADTRRVRLRVAAHEAAPSAARP